MNEHEPGHTSGTADRAPRDLRAPIQLIHLGDLAAQIMAELAQHDTDHTAYTIGNAAALRQVLIAFRAGGQLDDHHADGGVAIHVLAGEVAVDIQGTEYVLRPGDLLDLAPGLVHNVQARSESPAAGEHELVGNAEVGRPVGREGEAAVEIGCGSWIDAAKWRRRCDGVEAGVQVAHAGIDAEG